MNQLEYKNMSDEEIIHCVHKGNKDAMAYILEKYKPLVRSCARGLYLIGGESEDLIQEGMIGLFEAIQSYDEQKEASFVSFSKLCINRQMYSAITAAERKKHSPLNGYVSIEYTFENGEADQAADLSRQLSTQISAEDSFFDQINTNDFKEKIYGQLSRLEKQVFELYIDGIGYAQIAKILNKDQKAIDNALQRIKNKIKRR